MADHSSPYELRSRKGLPHKQPGDSPPGHVSTSPQHCFHTDISGSGESLHHSFEDTTLNTSSEKSTFSHSASINSSGDNIDSTSSPSRIYPVLEWEMSQTEDPQSMPRACEPLEQDSSQKKYIVLVLISGFILVLISSFLLLSTKNYSSEESMAEVDTKTFEKFMEKVNTLQQSLPNQKRRLWNTVKSAAKHVLNETDPEYPVTILLSSEAGHSHVTDCIADKVASTFDSMFDMTSYVVPFTDVKSLKHLSGNDQKLELDRAILKAFDDAKGRSFVIRNIQSLSAEGALLFHKYCDGDNAIFKNVMILFTVEMEDKGSPYTESEVEDYLVQIWMAEMNEDKVRAVTSRMANNIGIVHKEELSVLDTVCK